MDEFPGSVEIQKDLIKIDKEVPAFKNNPRAILALEEFISNPFVNKVGIKCDKPLLVKAFVEFVTKSAKFTFTLADAMKIENVEDLIRKSVVLCIKSSRDVYEGEITEIRNIRDDNNVLCSIEMTLKTLKSTKKINISKNLVNLVNDVNIGDVVYIEPNVGILKRIGRSETRINEFDLEGDRHIPLTKSSVHSTREKDIYVTLYDFDFAFNKYDDRISDFTRRHVDQMVGDYLQRGIAQLVCSGLYIENADFLSSLNSFRLVNASDLYPHLKILIDNINSEILNDSFLFIDSIYDEQPIDILKYFCKNLADPELKSTVEKVAKHDNFESIIAILSITNSPSEFIELFN